MCCFTRPVSEVSGTKIFARAGEGVAQFIVYEMRVSAAEAAAMVLPLPVNQGKGEKALRFIDLKEYPRFFDDLERAFWQPTKGSRAASGQFMGMGGGMPLPVERVGAFDASYVPTLADFSRLDGRFRMPAGVWEKLPMYQDWGFAVFKLRAGQETYHPMAFSFERRFATRLFFPTVHVHDGKVHKYADFDHMLYCQPNENGNALDLNGWKESDGPMSRHVKVSKTRGIADGGRHCYRLPIRGHRENKDHVVMET